MTGPPADPVDVVLPHMSFHEHDRRRAAELCVEALRRAGLLASGGSGEAPASVMLPVCDNCGDLAECEPGDECEVCCEGTIQRVEYAPVRASAGEAPENQQEFLERHGGRMGRVDRALAEARGEAPAGLTPVEWSFVLESATRYDQVLSKEVAAKLRAALRAPSSTGGREGRT